jgi:hypothetical protein
MGRKLEREKQVHLVNPEGTKVLTRPGRRVGIVAHAPCAPEHSYCVRFADRPEESFRRTDLTIFKHIQDEVPGGPDTSDASVPNANSRADRERFPERPRERSLGN